MTVSDYTLERLIGNITNNFVLLKSDFTGFSFNITGVIGVMFNILFVFGLTLVFYSIGDKIRLYFFRVNADKLNFFINIALGYIVISTGVSILGVFSILYKNILFVYLIVTSLIALYPFSKIRDIGRILTVLVVYARSNAFAFWGTALFVAIAFFRLIPPEIGEDAIGYHTSLPFLYLKTHSIIIDPKYSFSLVFPVPQLGEMTYIIAQSVGLKDASRYIHFVFYVIVVLLLFYIKSSKGMSNLGFYAPLLFVTAPVVIQVSSKANADFQWLLCWLLSIFLITKERFKLQEIILSAILFGGVLATKIWTIAFIPVFILFLLITNKNRVDGIKLGIFFLFFSFLVPALWYFRAFLLTGYPFYPGFAKTALLDYLGFNSSLFAFSTIITFGLLFYLGCIFLFRNRWNFIKKILRSRFFLFFSLLFGQQIFLSAYAFPRYLLGVYSLAVIVVSFGLQYTLNRSIIWRQLFMFLYIALFSYYFLNTILSLPYGFGWADKNKYLTRILSKDNSSYYDFDGLFSKWIAKKDIVATYGIYGYYYADFSFINTSSVFINNNRSFFFIKKDRRDKIINSGRRYRMVLQKTCS